ncbi:MAG: acyl-CoA/acyl-ACP dehydrogenase [Flavobacteriales bacterium]|nr:acyl-CoA/acyl-ACP dehydrogenase [Flavobacteriales bacterium]
MINETLVQKDPAMLLEKVKQLSASIFSKRADHYDRTVTFPKENFEDLQKAGLLAAVISEEYGGHNIGHYNGDIYNLWMMTKEIAKSDMAFARCWEGHNNSLTLLENIANAEQKNRWFEGVVERGEIWSAWSGEPQSPSKGEKQRFGTFLTEKEDGYLINGTKVFCTSAPGASWANLLVNTKGPGAARHSSSDDKSLLMLACDLSDPSVSFDDSWWDPIGMKGSVSYMVSFNDTFIPKENLIGYPGQFLTEEWQTLFTPQYAATFLGGAEAAYEYTLSYINKQNKGNDPYIQHRIAKMSLNIETANLWLRKTADLWKNNRIEEAKHAGSQTRYIVEKLAVETVNHAIHACGARSLVRPSSLERIYRDLSFYIHHDNSDQVLAVIGKSILGLNRDRSFFEPDKSNN